MSYSIHSCLTPSWQLDFYFHLHFDLWLVVVGVNLERILKLCLALGALKRLSLFPMRWEGWGTVKGGFTLSFASGVLGLPVAWLEVLEGSSLPIHRPVSSEPGMEWACECLLRDWVSEWTKSRRWNTFSAAEKPWCDSHRWHSALLPREHGFHLSLQGVCILDKKRCTCEMAALKGRVGGQESPVTSRSQKWVAASEYRVWCSEASVFTVLTAESERALLLGKPLRFA